MSLVVAKTAFSLTVVFAAASSVVACAAEVGNIRANAMFLNSLGVPSRSLEPARPIEPTRPAGFPLVVLLSSQTAGEPTTGRMQPQVAMVTPKSPPKRPEVETEPVSVDRTPEEPTRVEDGDGNGGFASDPDAGEPAPTPSVDLPDLSLPTLRANAPQPEKKFHKQASRILSRAYTRDTDDPSVLMALYERLNSDADLVRVREDWRGTLESGIGRAETLQRVSGSVRGIRAAFANAKSTAKAEIFSEINQAQCRSAFLNLNRADPEALDIKVTIEPVGRLELSAIEKICKESHESELSERRFPAVTGPKKLRKMIKRAYKKAYRRGNIRKITIPDAGWEVFPDEDRRELRAFVGISRKNAFPEDPCIMQEITLEQRKTGRRYGPPICCKVKSSVGISCKEIGHK